MDFSAFKIEKKKCWKNFDIFIFFAQNIDCWYTLEPPRRVPTIYVLDQKKENGYTPVFYLNVGYRGVYMSQTCFPDAYTVRKSTLCLSVFVCLFDLSSFLLLLMFFFLIFIFYDNFPFLRYEFRLYKTICPQKFLQMSRLVGNQQCSFRTGL